MESSQAPESQRTFPLELAYAVLDSFISNEPKLREIAPEDVLTFHPSIDPLLPVMLVSKPFYRHTIALIFRDIKCSSTARLHSLHEILQANPSLASYVKRLRIEQTDVVDPWLGDPVLPQMLDFVTKPGLDNLIIRGPQIANAVHQTKLPLSLHYALASITSQPGRLKRLHLFRLSVSDRLYDELGSEIDFLELHRVVSRRDETDVDPGESQMVQAFRLEPRAKPLQVTSLSLARAGSDAMWSMFRGHPEHRDPGLPLLHKLIIPEQLLSELDKRRVGMVKMEAPNLCNLRFTAYHRQCLEQFSDINELCGSGPFKHLEIVQRYVDMPIHTVPDAMVISFLSKATQHLVLETLTIAANISFDAEWYNWGTLYPRFREKRGELYQVLDQPFFARLHHVVLDFTDVSFNFPEVFSQMISQIQKLFPEETLKGSYVTFSLEHRF